MSDVVKELKVTSNVARDILASAQLFKSDYAVVWEYVVNSLQYCAPRVIPVIDIDLLQRQKLITIRDNGLGMNAEDLKHFFTMHGENKERKAAKSIICDWPEQTAFSTGDAASPRQRLLH